MDGRVNVMIGYDAAEPVAYHVLAHSILTRSSIPVSITPIKKDHLKGFYGRSRGKLDSTDFSITRFMCPFLCDFEGFSIFMDSDMLVLADIAELWAHANYLEKYKTAISVVKHDYTPKEDKKFLGQTQTKYPRKNWSSVMLFNNSLCKSLHPNYVEQAPGLDLHQFAWLTTSQIGELPKKWNWLVDEPGYEDIPVDVRLLHYTKGTPCFDQYKDCSGADLWHAEHDKMNAHG